MTDTIFALASGAYGAGVAVIRVSGAEAKAALMALTGVDNPRPREMIYTALTSDGVALDRAMAVYFKAPASFTGEDVVEFHVHGGRAVIDGVLSALSLQKSCRLAAPGEFTKRAFENGKLDLTEAEAVADLIAAETEAQRLQALDQLGGSLSRLYGDWTGRLSKILAHQEADIEFPEDDMPAGISDGLKPDISALISEISAHLNDNRRGERLREGVRIVILGAPNAGKSSLLNALAQRDIAIVSSEAGTTRDVLEAHLNLGGYPVIISDTAGLRKADSVVEAEGIRRARRAAEEADVRIALFDASLPEQDSGTLELVDKNTLVVFSKKDLSRALRSTALSISSQTGEGVDAFLTALTEKVANIFKRSPGPALTRQRHRTALEETVQCLEKSLAANLPELAAEDIRLALRTLGGITGRVHIEALLDKIFRDFCIGK